MTFELYEHVPIPVYAFLVAGEEFVLDYANAKALAQNPALAGLRGKAMGTLYRDQPRVIADARRAVAERSTFTSEHHIRRYDKTEATQSARLTFAFVAPSHLVIFMQEEARPDLGEAALRESETRYTTVVTSLPDGVLLRGSDGRILACNDALVGLVGHESQSAVLGLRNALAPGYRVVDEAGHEFSPDVLPGLVALASGESQPGRIFAIVHGEHERWVRAVAQPIRGQDGAVTGSVAIFSEITESVVAQRALRASTERLDLALAAARMGIWEYDPLADTGMWSENLGEIFARNKSEPGMKSFLEMVLPEDRDALLQRAASLAGSPDGDALELRFRIVGEDGVTRWAHLRGRTSKSAGRLRLMGTLQDVTAQHTLEEELRRAHRLESIGRLAGGIAHDFNNLLAAMMSSLELVRDQATPAMREDVDTIQHAADRARGLTKQLLAFARKQPIEFTTIDLSVMVKGVERMLRPLVTSRIQLVMTTEGRVSVRADAPALEQVIVNLVINARDAMPGGGRLDVRVGRRSHAFGSEAPKTVAMIEVSDSGVGMDRETLAHVFDPFFTTKDHGTGLGLASSYGTVKQHGGDLIAESVLGRGTTFVVLLPLAAEEASSVAPAREAETNPRKGRVLVIDDEDLVRRATVRVLAGLGYEVVSASGAEEAAAIARECAAIDLLVCDVVMPGTDGPSIAAALQASRPALKVLFLSGYVDGIASITLPQAAFLRKPFMRAELAAKLRELDVE